MCVCGGGGGGQAIYHVVSRGGSLDLNFVRRGGVIQNLDDGSKINNEWSLTRRF